MKKLLLNPLAVLLVGLVAFTSCKEDEAESIFFRTDGGISTVLKDAEGQAIADARVSLYNYRTNNRLDVQFTDENGAVNFGRFETGEYSVGAQFTHNGEYFSIFKEAHVISGEDIQEEINLENHYGEALVRLFDSSTGELLDFDPNLTAGFIPRDEEYRELINNDGLIDLVDFSFDAQATLEVADLPEADYVLILHNGENVLFSEPVSINPFDKEYVNFNVNTAVLRLTSQPSWSVSSVTSESNVANLVPITGIEFSQGGEMTFTFENGETDDASYFLFNDNNFDWYNISSDTYGLYGNEDYYEFNSDGSITFYFSYWETYNSNDGTTKSDFDVAITLN